tara:strand:+ start:93 stop:209 length:117 start_codon:yes stop_codon:yes gene_type:complete
MSETEKLITELKEMCSEIMIGIKEIKKEIKEDIKTIKK